MFFKSYFQCIFLVTFTSLIHLLLCSDIEITRYKRAFGLWDFCKTIQCTTNNPCWRYNNYGCFCGWGGSGSPVDDIDRCCQEHDRCYRKCRRYGCSVKWRGYQWSCVNSTVYCGSENSLCGDYVCECDQKAAACFAKYLLPFEKPVCVISAKMNYQDTTEE